MGRDGPTERRQAVADALPHLRRYARALMRDPVAADDLVQDTVVRALDRLDQWREGETPRVWLFTIMHNRFIDQGRARQRRPALVALDADGMREPAEPARQADRMMFNDTMAALMALPEDRRAALVLVGIEGLSYQEAAAVTGVPVGTLMSRLGRGRQQLREILGDGPRRSPKVVSVQR